MFRTEGMFFVPVWIVVTSMLDEAYTVMKVLTRGASSDDIEASEAKGREEGAKAMISMCKSLERGRLDTTEIIMNEMSYSQAEAEKLVSKYW